MALSVTNLRPSLFKIAVVSSETGNIIILMQNVQYLFFYQYLVIISENMNPKPCMKTMGMFL